MRIIGGRLKGRRFNPPADKWPTRPTTDFAKEGLFNILDNFLDYSSICVLDLFGGTGNHSFEFASRGCTDITYVDKFFPCIKFVKSTAEALEIADTIKVVRSDVFRFIDRALEQYDYIFAGPPYPLKRIPEIPDLIFEKELLKADGVLVVETNPNHNFEQHPHFWKLKTYGSTHFTFFKIPSG